MIPRLRSNLFCEASVDICFSLLSKCRVSPGCCQPRLPSEPCMIVSHHTAQAFRKSSALSGEPANYLTSRCRSTVSRPLKVSGADIGDPTFICSLIFRRFSRISRDGTPRGSGRPFGPDNVSIRIRSITERPLLSPRSQSPHPHGRASRFHFPRARRAGERYRVSTFRPSD